MLPSSPLLTRHLKQEVTIYKRLRPIQGIHVPVHLGKIDFGRPYFYDGIVEIVHIMFLSFRGSLSLNVLNGDNRQYLTKQVHRFHQSVPVSQYRFYMLVELVDVRVHDRASQDILASYQCLSHR